MNATTSAREAEWHGESVFVRLTPGPHLFIDDFLVAESVNLVRTTHQPEKLPEPVIQKGASWHLQPLFYMRVAYDAPTGLFRAWYNVKNPGGNPSICYAYAESKDGIKWYYPDLGLVTVGESDRNNLIDAPLGHFGLFMVDDGPGIADISRRYKMAYFVQGAGSGKNGLSVAFSPDGLRFRNFEGNAVQSYDPEIGAISDVVDGCWDPLKKEYLLVCKTWLAGYPGTPHYAPEGWRRCVGMSTSKDFINWPKPSIIVTPDLNNGIEEFYGFKPMVRGNLYIGFLRVLRDDLPADPDGTVAGIGWTELVTSRDGKKWTRYQDKFIDRNPVANTWDHAMAWFGECITVGDKEYIYYGGYAQGHKGGDRQVGLGFLRKDGFVSRDAGSVEGYLHTPPVIITGSAITVNANITGEIRARITDVQGKPLPGFGWKDCQPIQGDSLRHELKWTNADLPAFGDRPVRLEFRLRQAELYALDVI